MLSEALTADLMTVNRMLTIQLESDPYVGTLYLGRVHSGQLTLNTPLVALNAAGEKVRSFPFLPPFHSPDHRCFGKS
jgi:predicted membrane GTPase involved in stress response